MKRSLVLLRRGRGVEAAKDRRHNGRESKERPSPLGKPKRKESLILDVLAGRDGSPDSFKSVLAFFLLVGGGFCVLGGLVMASGLGLSTGVFQTGVGLVVLGVIAGYVGYRLGQDVDWKF